MWDLRWSPQWNVTSSCLVETYTSVGGKFCFHLSGWLLYTEDGGNMFLLDKTRRSHIPLQPIFNELSLLLWYSLEATFTLQILMLMSAIAVSKPPPNKGGQVRSQASPCTICGGQSGVVTYFSWVLCCFLPVKFHKYFTVSSFIFTRAIYNRSNLKCR